MILRLGFVVLILAAISVTLVHIRRQEVSAQHQIQSLEIRQVALRRKLWVQERDIARLTAPKQVYQRAIRMALIEPDGSSPTLAQSSNARNRWNR